jgi:hypothetical protein
MTRHVAESDLALYVSGDHSPFRRIAIRMHARGCERCGRLIEAYRADRERVRTEAAEMPHGVDWDRLAAEMTANIRVGLAAGECVAPRVRKSPALSWRPAAAMAGLAVLLAGAWWLNMPGSTTDSLANALSRIWHGRGAAATDDGGPVVHATSSGIEVRENGGTFRVSQGTAVPVAISVNAQGSASARYVDADTGQMTITSVYAQ